jgi:guanine deaminase
MSEARLRAFFGNFVNSISAQELEIVQATVVIGYGESNHGQILVFRAADAADENRMKDDDWLNDEVKAIAREQGIPEDNVSSTYLEPDQFIIPGFVDTHNHAPQWGQRGLGQGMHILDWLSAITFPNESRFADKQHAHETYESLVSGMLRQGVTTASYYGSLHGEATRILADECFRQGQRALIGKCNMDRGVPEYQDASAEESLAVTEACISYIKQIDPNYRLIRPVITPRFAISCTPALLAGLGQLAAREADLPIQTHFNEADQEVEATLSLFPEHKNEVSLYESYGLLNNRSILAHCTIMSESDVSDLQRLNCGVAHCPTANMTVGGGFMTAPVTEFIDRDIKVGLGTDSGGGFSSSMLDAMRHALIASFARQKHGGARRVLTIDEVFYMATKGGARVLGLDGRIGHFEPGMQFDALLVDMSPDTNGINAPVSDLDTDRMLFEKFIMTGDDRNIIEVFVGGKTVRGRNQWNRLGIPTIA